MSFGNLGDMGGLKSGGDASNIGMAGSATGNADSSGVGVGTGVLGAMGLGGGLSGAATGDAGVLQGQGAAGGGVADNTNIGDININT